MRQLEILSRAPVRMFTRAQMDHFWARLMKQSNQAEEREEAISRTWKRRQVEATLPACFEAL